MSPIDSLSGRTVLVTGASGFIGSHLCRRLTEAGATVHATSRQPRSGSGLRWHRLDVADRRAVDGFFTSIRPEIIFHLASHVAGSRGREAVRLTFDANLASTVALLDAAERVGCRRFIQVGSLEEPAVGEPVATPASPYAAAKAAASGYCRMFHALYETPVVLARLFMVYGPAQQDLKKLIPYVILSLLRGRELRLSSGTRPVDWVYVEDVVDALLRAAQVEGLEGKQVDLGSGALVPIRTVVEKLYQQLAPAGEPPFGTLPERPMEQVRAARVEETEALLGWRPLTSLDQGLKATAHWYRRELEAGRLPVEE